MKGPRYGIFGHIAWAVLLIAAGAYLWGLYEIAIDWRDVGIGIPAAYAWLVIAGATAKRTSLRRGDLRRTESASVPIKLAWSGGVECR